MSKAKHAPRLAIALFAACALAACSQSGTPAANPGHATRMAKRMMREGMDQKLPTHYELAAAYQALSHHTDDHREAVSAFMDKRAPELRDR